MSKNKIPHVLALLFAANAQGANITWDGSADPANAWVANPTNWVGDIAPIAGDGLIFDGTTNLSTVNDLASGTAIAGITYAATAGAFTIAGNEINLTAALVNNSTALQTISAPLTYNTTTREFNTAAGDVTLSGTLNSGAASGIIKNGAATLNLTGSGTIGTTGAGGVFPFSVRQGTVRINTAGTYTVTGETALGDNGAGGAGNDVNMTIDNGNFVSNNWFSLARGNGTGTSVSSLVLNNASKLTTVNLGAGFNANNVNNKPRGTLTLNDTSTLEVTANNGNFNWGESAGSFLTMTLNGSSNLIRTNGGATQIRVGMAGKGIININSSTATATIRNFIIGQGSGGVGAVYNKGTIKFNTNDGYFLGDGANSSSYLRNDNAGATVANDSAATLSTAIGLNANSVVDVISGTLPANRIFAGAYNTNAANSQINVVGGTLAVGIGNTNVNDTTTRGNKHAVFNITDSGKLTNTGSINLSLSDVATNTSILSLYNGGTASATEITVAGANPNTFVNFDNGTLQASAAAPTNWINPNIDSVVIHDGGATFDTNGHNKTINRPLVSPAGNGVTAIALATGGIGYVGRPLVKITDGGGTGATAIAEYDHATGTVTGITITSPGSGYTGTPTVTLNGGGATTAATLGAVTTGAVTGGGITKIGAGTLTLTGANTFTGNINVNGGGLAIGGTQNNAILVNNGGSLIVADPAGPVGTLTVPSLTLANGSSARFELSGVTSDLINVSTPATGLTLGTAQIYLYASGTTNFFVGTGTYNLIQNTGFTGSTSGLSVANPAPGYNYAFAYVGDFVQVTISFTDTDIDGIPDLFETANGLDPNDPSDGTGVITLPPTVTPFNLDGDFSTNFEEFAAGTSLTSAASDPNNTDNDLLRDSWEITNFTNLTTSNGNADYDGDVTSDALEFYAGTNPKDPTLWTDSDSDGMNDAWEIKYFTTITAKNGTVDTDTDGATDLDEFIARTNPTDAAWTPTKAKPIHRWSFNGSLEDSIATVTGPDGHTKSDATIVDPNGATASSAVTLTATEAIMAGGAKATSDYIQLGSNLLNGRTTPTTIQLWATPVTLQNWSRVFDFHSSVNEYLMLSWTQGTNIASDRTEWKDVATSTSDNLHAPFQLGVEYHIVFIFEPAIGAGGTNRVTTYVARADGADLGGARSSFDTANNLANLLDTVNSLGFSPYPDNTANAKYNEVRMWNGALTSTERESLHDLGPDLINTTDTDNDGLPDAWEIAKFTSGLITTQDGDDDTDGDLFSNLDEFNGRSHPAQIASTPNDTDADGLSDVWEITFFTTLAQTGTGDPDGDLANNEFEETASTNPTIATSYPDADNDLLNDAWEILYFANIAAKDGTLDSDGDGFTDLQEFAGFSNPTLINNYPTSILAAALPATGTDAASGISSTKTYTHAIDFGQTITAVTLNGVAFHQVSVPAIGNDGSNNDFFNSTDTTGGRNGAFSLSKTLANDWGQNNINVANIGADGQMYELLTDFTHSSGTQASGSSSTVTLGGLTVGTRYKTRIYYRPWTLAGVRDTIINANGNGQVTTLNLNQDISTVPFAGYVEYNFNANDTDVSLNFTLNNTNNAAWHIYALTNEVVPEDSDNDGLLDLWEIAKFGNIAAQTSTGDPDADGTSNRAEYLLGLDPNNGTQAFTLNQSSTTPGTTNTLTWPAQNGLTFTVWRSPDLTNWTQLGGTITASGLTATYTDAAAPLGKSFYRIVLTTP